jgi:ABC-type antimicrobial peptide transport system permease subunit
MFASLLLFAQEHSVEEEVSKAPFYIAASVLVGFALLLATVGIYGLVAGSVNARTKEIGIRMALGAPAVRVGGMVLREAMTVVLSGLGAGLAAGAAASRLLRGLLYGIGPTDPVTYAVVATVLITVAAVAVLIPARTAMRNDPIGSLKVD